MARLFERIIDEARRSSGGSCMERRPGSRERWRIRGRRAEVMVVVMEERATEAADPGGRRATRRDGLSTSTAPPGATRTVLGAVGAGTGRSRADRGAGRACTRSSGSPSPYKLASRTFKPENTVITVGRRPHRRRRGHRHGRPVLGRVRGAGRGDGGGGQAAPAPRSCVAARSSRAVRRTASRASAKTGCRLLREAADGHDLKLVTEVMDISQIELIERYADIFQVGARNMQNFTAAARARPRAQARAAEARHLGHDRGVAAVGRVRAQRRQH